MVNDKATPAGPARLKVQVDHTKSLLRELTQSTYLVRTSTNCLWIPPVQPKYVKPEFQPKYRQRHYESDKAINAIIEIRTLWRYVIHEAYYNYSNMYSQLSIPLTERIKLICQKHKEAFAVYDTKTQKWLIEPAGPDYKYCYNGEFFEEFKQGKKQMPTANRLLLVGKFTMLKQEVNLLTETKTAPTLLDTFVMPEKSLTVGVPGCGKTTYILENHRYGSLVLTSCAEGAQDIRSRMARLKEGRPSDYRNSYRTIDSYLLNSRKEYSEVWIDEALMEHPGKLFLVCLYSRCRKLSLLGDPNQLGYINRVNAIRLRYDKSSMFFKATKTLNISYRCPVDAMAVLSSKYDEGAYSASKLLRSMKCKSFTYLKDVPKVEDTKYLVFKQAEKKQMQKSGYDVSTVHEFQGKEAKHVILVRMSRNLKEELYESPAHILVGITRHRESLIYFTPVRDSVQQIIEKSQAIEQLTKYQKTSSLVFRSSDLQTDTSAAFNSYFYARTGAFPSISITPQTSTLVTPSASSNDDDSRYLKKYSLVDDNSFYPKRTTPAETTMSVSKNFNCNQTTTSDLNITNHAHANSSVADSSITKQTTSAPGSSLEPSLTDRSHRRQLTFSAYDNINHRPTNRSVNTNSFKTKQTIYYPCLNNPLSTNERSRPSTTPVSNKRCTPCCCIQ